MLIILSIIHVLIVYSYLQCIVIATYTHHLFSSLDNVSNDIRWSLDLRWSRAEDPTGFHGLKDGIRMRSSEDPDNYVITEEAWNNFDSIDRHREIPGYIPEDSGFVSDVLHTLY